MTGDRIGVKRGMRASVPYSLLPHASWATPRVSPMIRMALTHSWAVRAAAWRHRCTPTGGVETAVAVGVPSRADGSFGAWLRPWRIVLIAKRSALDETHGPDWPLPRDLRHGWELHHHALLKVKPPVGHKVEPDTRQISQGSD